MAEKYSSELLHIVIAQIAQTIGYSSTQSAPLELLEDILQRFIQELACDLHSQAEHANRNEPNLTDISLSLKNLSINVHELLDYIGNVEPVPFLREVSAYPVKKVSHLNFLKPGSAETLTRPVHIFEYLPPMLPSESNALSGAKSGQQRDHKAVNAATETLESIREPVMGGDTSTKALNELKTGLTKWCSQSELANRSNLDTDGYHMREINSVVMTTGGFISPAIEGKLPKTFVPDIINQLQGLDVPPSPPQSPPIQPEIKPTLQNDVAPVDGATRKPLPILEVAQRDEWPKLESNAQCVDLKSEAGLKASSSAKTTKKSKKKYMTDSQAGEQSGKDLMVNKAQEKAQRKALKMYQKLSKSQIESDNNILGLKQSIKTLNRGMLSSLPDSAAERAKLEKMLKKQRQRQKQIKNQQRQLQTEGVVSKAFALNTNALSAINVSGLKTENAELPATLTGNLLALDNSPDKREKFLSMQNARSAEGLTDTSSAVVDGVYQDVDAIKLASEPDRNKLNIFKKISKQKTNKAPSPPKSLQGLETNLLENLSHGSPLINLPSGTTITPAPALYSSMTDSGNVNVTYPPTLNNMNYVTDSGQTLKTFLASNQAPVGAINNNMLLVDVNKPKKRGRKPGAKLTAKPTAMATTTEFNQPQKKAKPDKSKSYATNLALNPNENIPHSPLLGSAMEPLNLSHVEHLKVRQFATSEPNAADIKIPKVKEKRERKKAKAKFNYLDQQQHLAYLNTQFPKTEHLASAAGMDRNLEISPSKLLQAGVAKKRFFDTSTTLAGTHDFAAGSSAPGSMSCLNLSGTPNPMYSTNQTNMMPMLPLLHFSPRPGLIPSGPTLFPPSLTNFDKNVCNPGSTSMLPQSFMPFSGSTRPGTNMGRSAGLLGVMPLTDNSLERSYCNVAPLVPESMKLITEQKLTNLHAIGDTKPSNLCEPKRHETMIDSLGMSKIMPFAPIAGTLGGDDVPGTRSDKTAKATTIAGTGNLGDPIEVSDDSNDNEFPKKPLQQSSNIPPKSDLQEQDLQVSDKWNSMHTSHNTSIHSPISDSKQLKKLAKVIPLKKSQLQNDNSLLASPFHINMLGTDKFSLAGGADLIPLARLDNALAYPSQMATTPGSTLAGATMSATSHAPSQADDQKFVANFMGSVNYDDITITPTNNLTVSEPRLRKLHKKLKKTKEGKIKKKKDKKDKWKNKSKVNEMSVPKPEKPISLDKKAKKEKKKEKQMSPEMLQNYEKMNSSTQQTKSLALSSSLGPVAVAVSEAFHTPGLSHFLPTATQFELSPNQVPKLTLKLNGKSTPTLTPTDAGDHESTVSHPPTALSMTPTSSKREHSPELARFSPLVTGPPKAKQCEAQALSASVPMPASTNAQVIPNAISNTLASSSSAISTAWIPDGYHNTSTSATLSASSVLLPQQLLQASKPMPKMTSAPLVISPGHADPSSAPAKAEPSQPSVQSAELTRPSSYVDAEGYRIWICPACGKVDDGSAMIGCDGCDAWYHWTCVGIFVAPKDNEDWFCRVCVTKKKVDGSEKKKKRNKKK